LSGNYPQFIRVVKDYHRFITMDINFVMPKTIHQFRDYVEALERIQSEYGMRVSEVNPADIFPSKFRPLFQTANINSMQRILNDIRNDLDDMEEDQIKFAIYFFGGYIIIMKQFYLISFLPKITEESEPNEPADYKFHDLGITRTSLNRLEIALELLDYTAGDIKNANVDERDLRFLRTVVNRIVISEM